MSREELIRLINNIMSEREFEINPINKVSVCECCGSSQGYDKYYFENSDLNFRGVRCLEI